MIQRTPINNLLANFTLNEFDFCAEKNILKFNIKQIGIPFANLKNEIETTQQINLHNGNGRKADE